MPALRVRSHEHHYWENGYIKAFVYGLALSFLVFIPFMIYDQGYFLFYGDFNVQQVPFYQMCHDAIRSGNIGWSHTTDLGANFIGSYTFYLLGSPFFWLTIPFPSDFVPYMMGPLFMLKFGCASLTSFVFLKRYCSSPRIAIIGGLLYAFSGFSVYNVFFNHFHEAIIIFPLMLAALDAFVLDKKRGLFALTVFMSCTMNYYFFVGQVAFVIIYWAVRMIARSYKMKWIDFLWLMVESFTGFVMSFVLLVPSVLAVLQNNRVSNSFTGWNALVYSNNQRYIHIIQSMFFPPDLPARPNFTPDSNSKWSSLGAWLPLFSMTGVFAYIHKGKQKWLKVLIPLLILFAFVPMLNSAFQLFNADYYARWFYMLTLMFSLATVMSLDDEEIKWRPSIILTAAITLGMGLAIGLIPTTDDDGNFKLGLENYPDRFWAYVAIAMLSLLTLAVIFIFFRKNKKLFYRILTIAVAVISVGYSIFFIALGKTHSHDDLNEIIPYELNGGDDLNLPGDIQTVRSDFYNSMDNVAMYWQIPSINAFHSIVPGSVMEFYPTVGVTRDVGSRPDTSVYAIRSFLSCKWLFDYAGDADSFTVDGDTRMPGWKYYDTQNGFDIYENENFIPMGYSYDYYYTREEYDNAPEATRQLMLLKGIVIEEENEQELTPLLKSASAGNFTLSEKTYPSLCKERASMACSSFNYTNTGFDAEFTSDGERLVFFSVPYESGWSAQVNGQDAEIYKVNVGFMAVKVGAGENKITFTYKTPGLGAGIIMSGCGFGAFIVYCGVYHTIRRKRRAMLK